MGMGDRVKHDENTIDLSRFIKAQENVYARAYDEILNGRKESHWMWYIFPQIKGLGSSAKDAEYSINNLDEARAYLNNEILGKRLRDISYRILMIDGKNINEILGSPDDLKLKSSMTLFQLASDEGDLFQQVLDKYYDGKMDEKTIAILESMK